MIRSRSPRAAPSRLGVSIAFAATVLALLVAAAPVSALGSTVCPLPGSNFQGADGNQDSASTTLADCPTQLSASIARADWQNVATTARLSADPDAPNSAFKGGTKETAPDDWEFVTESGGVNPPKTNIFAAWNQSDFASSVFFYFAFHREVTTGDTYLQFELNKATTRWRNTKGTVIPCRTDGDLVISYEIGGGGTVDVNLYEWNGSGGPLVSQGPGLDACPDGRTPTNGGGYTGGFKLVTAGANVQGAMNFAGAITNHLDYDNDGLTGGSGDPATFAAGTFGESAINLSATLGAGGNGCFDFGQMQMHSRSSQSISSDLSDFIAPVPLVLRNCSVDGVKFNDLNGDGDRDGGENGLAGWTIWVDYDNDGERDSGEPFDVTADGTDPAEPIGSYAITGIQSSAASTSPVGKWSVREELKPNWECTAAVGAGAVTSPDVCPEDTSTTPANAKGFELAWTSNEAHKNRDFGNKLQPATLKVVKQVVNDDGGTKTASDFPMNVTDSANAHVSTSPDPGSSTGTVHTLTDGATYTVTEDNPGPGYAQSYSGDCNSSGQVTVAAGSEKTCTITNNDVAPRLTVTKTVVNDDGGTKTAGDFTMNVKQGASHVSTSPHAGDAAGTVHTLDAGSFTVTEDDPGAGYSQSYSGDCDANGDVTLVVGDDKACTITNNDVAPKLTVIKDVVNDDGGTKTAGDFTMNVKEAASHVSTSPHAGDAGGTQHTLSAGSFKVTEDDPGAGYEAAWSGDCDADGDITLAVGDVKSCTITNDDVAPKLTVIKDVVNDHGGTKTAADFSITIDDASTSDQTFPGAAAPGTTKKVAPGGYSVDEGAHAGYAKALSGDCAGSIAIGQTKTCTITNNDVAPELTVIKNVVNKGSSNARPSDFQMDVTATDASDPNFPGTSSGKTITLDAGPYSVDESGGPTTFEKALSADCAGSIAIGQKKTCTITNTKILPGINVAKKGSPTAYHGDTLTFTFEVSNPVTSPLEDVRVTDDRCAPVSGPTQKQGGNQDSLLEAGELWLYTCTMGVPEHSDGDSELVNTATLSAKDRDGEAVTDSDSHTTRILHPAIALDKTGPFSATAGALIDFTLTVTNPGDRPLHNVDVSDPRCTAPPALHTKNRGGGLDPTPDTLDPGDSWVFGCSGQSTAGETEFVNTATVSATDGGRNVSASDGHTTPLNQQQVLGERVSSGSARLGGATGCRPRPFIVRVKGRSIVRVDFSIDGKKRKTVKKPDSAGRWNFRINPRRFKRGAHRVVARAVFQRESGTPPRKLRLRFSRCVRAAQAPAFTG